MSSASRKLPELKPKTVLRKGSSLKKAARNPDEPPVLPPKSPSRSRLKRTGSGSGVRESGNADRTAVRTVRFAATPALAEEDLASLIQVRTMYPWVLNTSSVQYR